MKNLFQIARVYFQDPKSRISFGLSALAILGLLLISMSKDAQPVTAEVATSDDFIPEGFVLVPLDLQNREALNALVGGFAVVDLFAVSPDGQTKGIKVGRRLKLVRSPQQPDQFAALVPEEQSVTLLGHAGPLFAVVQSRQAQKGSSLVGKTKNSRIRVEGEGK